MKGMGLYELIKIIAIVAGFVLSGMLVSSAEPPKGEASEIPIKVEVKAPFPIAPELQDKLVAISQDLIRKNLSEVLAKSLSSSAETNILEKTPKGYIVEIVVISLFKETFTAQMSRIEFAYEDGQVTIRKIERSFQPK